MAKYKVGDRVRVRKDLKGDVQYNMETGGVHNVAVSSMLKFAGKIVTIKSVVEQYTIAECGFLWTDEMFDGIAEENPDEKRELKAGDKVRVRPDLESGKRYDDCLVIDCMVELAGMIVAINAVKDKNRYTIKGDSNGLLWSSEMFILDGFPEVESHKQSIIITSDGKKTTAIYRNGDKTREAFCRCSPKDAFDFVEGAKIAFSRLWEDDDDDDPAEEVGYDGDVICVQRGYGASAPVDNFTVGKIYTVVDGRIKGDRVESAGKYYSLEMLCLGMGHKFIPLVK